MKSTIRIDFVDNGKGLEPVLQVVLEDTNDTRDSLLKTFFQALQGESSWLKVNFNANSESDWSMRKYITIYPVKPSELETEGNSMLDRIPHISN